MFYQTGRRAYRSSTYICSTKPQVAYIYPTKPELVLIYVLPYQKSCLFICLPKPEEALMYALPNHKSSLYMLYQTFTLPNVDCCVVCTLSCIPLENPQLARIFTKYRLISLEGEAVISNERVNQEGSLKLGSQPACERSFISSLDKLYWNSRIVILSEFFFRNEKYCLSFNFSKWTHWVQVWHSSSVVLHKYLNYQCYHSF